MAARRSDGRGTKGRARFVDPRRASRPAGNACLGYADSHEGGASGSGSLGQGMRVLGRRHFRDRSHDSFRRGLMDHVPHAGDAVEAALRAVTVQPG